MQKILMWGSILVGLLLVTFAVIYFSTPAGNLPHWLPGFMAESDKIHYKHGFAAMLLGIGIFIFAWFQSAPLSSLAADESMTDDEVDYEEK